MRTLLILWLALAWVPVTSHCLLEPIVGDSFLRCAESTSERPGQAEHCDDGCCALEASLYLPTSHAMPSLAPIAQALAMFDPPMPAGITAPETVGLGLPATAPPHLPRTWHFRLRAALPPRAPSLPS